MLWQPALPDKYNSMTDSELEKAISARRKELAGRVVILGHHYQQNDVIKHADFTGDSFKLSQLAAEQVQQSGADTIVYCGVHFMAESADILTADDVRVVLPDISAGCSMADMADADQTEQAWDEIQQALDDTKSDGQPPVRVIPITYMNSSAAIKSFVGQHGGAVCTSTNAAQVFEWALKGGDEPLADGETIKILFLPDQHLGRNTAHHFGFVTEVDARLNPGKTPQTAIWDPYKENGGLTPEQIRRTDILLWKGHCSVHMLFRPEHTIEARRQTPGIRIVVHPECMQEVVDLADEAGSTEYILNTVRKSEPGQAWAVGTEIHLVNRLAEEMAQRDVSVSILSGMQCLCTTMYRISPQHLLWVLDQLAETNEVDPNNVIKVPNDIREGAILALDRMLRLTNG